MKPYPRYKNASAPWLEHVPEHWNVLRLGSLFVERKEKVSDKDFMPLSVTKKGILPQLKSAAKSNDGDNRKKVCKGDFVINSRSDRKGSSGISSLTGSVSLINTVLTPLSLDERYVHNLFRSYSFREEFYRLGHGIVSDLWCTKYVQMRKIMIPVPTQDEQRQIARYIDWQTSKINQFINIKKKLIVLLREQKQNIINEAVTKGINPNAKIKDIAVKLWGRVPARWDVKKLKHCVQNINNQTDYCKENETYLALENVEGWSGKITPPVEKVAFDSKVKKYSTNDILFGKLRPYLAKVALPKFDGVCVGEFLVLRSMDFIVPEFMCLLLRSKTIIDLINASTYGAKMPRADWGFIGSVYLAIPSIDEQKLIVLYIEKETALIDKTIARTEQEITLMQEYHTRLVSDVVTGKVDVRDIKVPSVDFAEADSMIYNNQAFGEDIEDMVAENDE